MPGPVLVLNMNEVIEYLQPPVLDGVSPCRFPDEQTGLQSGQ